MSHMLSLDLTRNDDPVIIQWPEGISPGLQILLSDLERGFSEPADENGDCHCDNWEAAKAAIIAWPSRDGLDVAAKLLAAIFETSPEVAGKAQALAFDPGHFPTDATIRSFASCVNDLLRLSATRSAPASAVDARAVWDAAMRHLEEIERPYRAHVRDVSGPIYEEAERLFGKQWWSEKVSARFKKWDRYDELHRAGERSDELCDGYITAEAAVYQTPAPDRAALLWKLERALENPDEGDVQCHAEALLADCRRLLGEA